MKFEFLSKVKNIKIDGELALAVGSSTINGSGKAPILKDGRVLGMPKQKNGVTYIVSAVVFEELKSKRNDLAMFDNSMATRLPNGWVDAHYGLLYS